MRMLRALRGIVLVVAFGLGVVPVRSALAQIPPHPPGTICFTQYFWCWAQPPGPPGSGCVCPTPQGNIPGIRG